MLLLQLRLQTANSGSGQIAQYRLFGVQVRAYTKRSKQTYDDP